MTVYEIDPIGDERWDEFLQKHTDASIFHTRGWLEALRQTYDYKPVAFTTSPPGQPLTNGFPFCQISSWLSGSRLVSLPFSDHCAPLVESSDELTHLLTYLQEKLGAEKWSYIEIRPTDSVVTGAHSFWEKQEFSSSTNWTCVPALMRSFRISIEIACREKFSALHERGSLTRKEDQTRLLTKFYHLLLMTRRRHGLPAQPVDWFRNILACVGR